MGIVVQMIDILHPLGFFWVNTYTGFFLVIVDLRKFYSVPGLDTIRIISYANERIQRTVTYLGKSLFDLDLALVVSSITMANISVLCLPSY